MKFWCTTCHQTVNSVADKVIQKTKNGQPYKTGTCPKCKRPLAKFIKKPRRATAKKAGSIPLMPQGGISYLPQGRR